MYIIKHKSMHLRKMMLQPKMVVQHFVGVSQKQNKTSQMRSLCKYHIILGSQTTNYMGNMLTFPAYCMKLKDLHPYQSSRCFPGSDLNSNLLCMSLRGHGCIIHLDR